MANAIFTKLKSKQYNSTIYYLWIHEYVKENLIFFFKIAKER